MRGIFWGAVALLSWTLNAAPLTPPLGAHAAVGVVGAQGFEVAHHIDDMIAPASTMKVVTALAARLELGADFRFETRLLSTPNALQNGVLQGDLWIDFSGDPTLTRSDILNLLASAKITRVQGNVYLYSGAYNGYERGNGWSWGDQSLCFTAPVASIIIDRNCTYGTITAPAIGQPATAKAPTGIPVSISAEQVRVVSMKEMASSFCALEVDMARGNHYDLRGCITPSKEPQGLRFAIHDVEAWGWDSIRWGLERAKIGYSGTISVQNQRPESLAVVATHQSKPLPELLARMLKRSDNLYADTLFKTVGHHYYQQPGSFRSGAQAVRAILSKAGVKLDNTVLADGSGLSAHNLISARQMLSVLEYIRKHDAELGLIALLPSSQVDGTLAWRGSVTAPMLKNRVHAKTGTVNNASNLAGFIDTASGQRKAFVVFQEGLALDPVTYQRYKSSKARWPWTTFEKAVLEGVYQQQPIQIAQ